MERQEVTQADMARLLGVSRQRVCQLAVDPEFPVAVRLGRLYDLTEIRGFLRRRALLRLERHAVGRIEAEECPRICLNCGADLTHPLA